MSKFARVGKVPADFYVIEPTLNALDEELKKEMSRTVQGNKRGENLWPIHQIDWQRTRYVHDMFYKFKRIDQATFDYCVRNKLINGPLSAKWKEPGYEKLCSLHAIDSRNFNFGGVSICRTPRAKLVGRPTENARYIFNGCLGCGSGEAGVENIFGNKYGQRLAEVQIKREEQQQEEAKRKEEEAAAAAAEKPKKKKKRTKQQDGADIKRERKEDGQV